MTRVAEHELLDPRRARLAQHACPLAISQRVQDRRAIARSRSLRKHVCEVAGGLTVGLIER